MKQKPYLMMALGLIVGLGVGILGTYYMVNRNNVEELITSQQARDIVMNVLSPAECLLLDLSQPIMADKTSEITILNTTDQSPSSDDHPPSISAIGS